MKIPFVLLFSLFGALFSIPPERSAVYMMNQQLVWVRDHSRYEDESALKSLFDDYPKEFNTEQKWPKVMSILKSFEFTTLDAKYLSFDSFEEATELSGTVSFHVADKNATMEIRLRHDMGSTTEWKMEKSKFWSLLAGLV